VWFLDQDDHAGRNCIPAQRCRLIACRLANFPNRVTIIPRADFDFIVGQGLVTGIEPIETDPVCLISWSDDGGQTTSNTPLKRSLGRQAKFIRHQ
jgi:hypothetical protein